MAETETKEAPAAKPDSTAGKTASKFGDFYEQHKKAILILAGLFVLFIVYYLMKGGSSSSANNPNSTTNPFTNPLGVSPTDAGSAGVGSSGPTDPNAGNGPAGMVGPTGGTGGDIGSFGGQSGSISSSFVPNFSAPSGFIPSQIGSVNGFQTVQSSSNPPVQATQTGGNRVVASPMLSATVSPQMRANLSSTYSQQVPSGRSAPAPSYYTTIGPGFQVVQKPVPPPAKIGPGFQVVAYSTKAAPPMGISMGNAQRLGIK